MTLSTLPVGQSLQLNPPTLHPVLAVPSAVPNPSLVPLENVCPWIKNEHPRNHFVPAPEIIQSRLSPLAKLGKTRNGHVLVHINCTAYLVELVNQDSVPLQNSVKLGMGMSWCILAAPLRQPCRII